MQLVRARSWATLSAAILSSILIVSNSLGTPPPEVQNHRFDSPVAMHWDPTPGATAYNLYRGLLTALPGSYGTCLQPNLPLPNTTDGAVPAAGTGFQYMVSAINSDGEGIFGFDSSGFPRPNTSPCPTGSVVLHDLINPNGITPDGATQGVEPARNPSIANDLTGLIGGGLYLNTGEYFAQVVDLEIPGRGMNYRMVRAYRSQINHNGQVGFNWTHNYDRRIVISGPDLLYLDGEGRQDRFVSVGGALYEPSLSGIYAKIRQNFDGSWSMRDRDGTIYHHHSNDGGPLAGLLQSIENRLGDRIALLYDPNGQLQTVVDTLGRSITYIWRPDGRLDRIHDYSGREVVYQYDAFGNLTQVRRPIVVGTSTGNDFPAGKTTVYTYASGTGNPFLDHNLLTITAPGDSTPVVQNNYNPSDELQTQFYGGTNGSGVPAGGVYQLTLVPLGGGARRATLIDRVGIQHVTEHDTQGHATREQIFTIGLRGTDPPFFETLHTYNAQGERLSTNFPLGNRVQYTYDSANVDRFQRGNLMSVTRVADATRGDGFGGALPNITVSYQYESLGTQQRTITDPLGRQTVYTFDYQEANPGLSGVFAYTNAWGMGPPTAPGNLGDVNGDGAIELCTFSDPASAFGCGNPVSLQQPTVTVLAGGKQAGVEGAATQPIVTLYRYNAHHQIRVEVEPELNVKTFTYWPETDPDGDGIFTPPPADGRPLDGADGGHLRISVLDDDPTPHLTPVQIARRDNATNPPATAIRNDYSYDARGNLIASIDGNGVQTSFEVNALGQIVSVRRGQTSFRSIDNSPDPPVNGFVSRQYFNARDEIVRRSVQDPVLADSFFDVFITLDILGNTVSMSQDVSNGITATTQYRYNAQGGRTSITFPEGNINTLKYDERALVFRLVRGDNDLDAGNGGPVGSSLQVFNYDRNGNPNQFVDGRSASWNFTYDGDDRRVRSPIVTTGLPSFFDVFYNADESINSIKVRQGATTLYDALYFYDEIGRMKEARQGIRNSAGALIPGEDFNNDGYSAQLHEFDRNGRRTRTYSDKMFFHDFDFDGVGHMVKTVDPLGNQSTLTYDDDNNVLQTLETENGPGGLETRSASSTYDRLNRKKSASDALGQVTLFTYDSRDNLVGLQDALQNTTSYEYNAKGDRTRIVRDMRPGGHGPGPVVDQIVSQIAFDKNGRVKSMTDPGNHVTQYTYDNLDRKTRDTFDDQTLIQYGYDTNDNLVSVVDANGSLITITYDTMDRPTGKAVAPVAGVHGSTVTYQYDAMNRLIQTVDTNDVGATERATVNFVYDSLNRVRTESSTYGTNPARTQTFTYDGNGNRRQANYSSPDTMQYNSDPLDRLIHVQDAVAGFQTDYSYIGPERVAERRHGNTTRKSYLNPPGTIDIGYDPLKRTRAIRHYQGAGAQLAGFDYTYDQVGNVTSETRLHHVGRGDVWIYDSAYRLVDFKRDVDIPAAEAANPGTGGLIRHRDEFTLDRVGNWLNHRIDGVTLLNSTPNNLNEYDENQSGGTRVDDGVADDFGDNAATIPPDGVNLGHDKNGDLTKEGTKTYEYDVYHRLVTVRTAAIVSAHYVYDGLNRRVAKHNLSTGVRSRFVYDGDRIVEERDLSAANVEGALKRRYFAGTDTPYIAVQNAVTLQLFYIHEDLRNSTVMATNSGGAVVERITYDAYGAPQFQDAANNPTGATESSIGNPFLYQGRYYDPETQFYETRGAIYAPRFGRHIQRFVPGQMVGPQVLAYNPPMVFPVPIAWIGMNPFWWCKNWFWNPGVWWGGWWAWRPFWWMGGPWGWWRWQPWVWFVNSADWWVLRPWWGWWGAPFRWWGWQAWWGWGGFWGWWPWWGWGGWGWWMPAWGWLGWCNWWPWWGWGGWCGWWLGFGWWGWNGWWPWWNFWWCWHPWWWGGWWTWCPWWWWGYWGWSGVTWWWNWWFWIAWRPWKWWVWFGWGWWWGWWGWNPWWWCGWWGWWWWGWNYGWYWWWGPYCWNVWYWGWMPWYWFGWWNWFWPWGWWCWGWWGWTPIWWWGFWWGPWWWLRWGYGWWGWGRWWGWWWPWWGWWW